MHRVFSDDKPNFEIVMMGFKTKYTIQVWYLCCENTGENVVLTKHANKKGWRWNLSVLSKVFPKELLSQMDVCYPFQLGTCHAQ